MHETFAAIVQWCICFSVEGLNASSCYRLISIRVVVPAMRRGEFVADLVPVVFRDYSQNRACVTGLFLEPAARAVLQRLRDQRLRS